MNRSALLLTLSSLLVPALAMAQDNPGPNPLLEQLRGTTYRLSSVTVGGEALPLPAKPAITIRFDGNGKINGHSTVNLFFGSVQISSDGTIQWGSAGFAVTRRSGPETLMDLETLFLQALERTTTLTLEGDTLTLSSSDPTISMVFQAQAAQQPLAALYGKPLTLTQLNSAGKIVALPAKPLLNLTVTAEGTCYGFSGVNRFFGRFEIAPIGSVNSGPFGSTMMAGPSELMDLESAYLKALAASTKAEFSAGVVTFSDASGATILQFQLR